MRRCRRCVRRFLRVLNGLLNGLRNGLSSGLCTLRVRGCVLIDSGHDPDPPEVIFAQPMKVLAGYTRNSSA
jgi:hypothetical protein